MSVDFGVKSHVNASTLFVDGDSKLRNISTTTEVITPHDYLFEDATMSTSNITAIDTSTNVVNLSLPDGSIGDRVLAVMIVAGNNCIITPVTYASGTTVTLNAVGNAVEFIWTTNGWVSHMENGVVVA